MSRPNFLFMIADDHRHSALGALGTEAVSTPTFDQLIAEGTCFTPGAYHGLDLGRCLHAQPRHVDVGLRPLPYARSPAG